MKRVTPTFPEALRAEGNIGEAVEQEVKLCDEVETVSEFTYLGDRVSDVGGCVVAVAARTRCGWVKFRECGELLYGRRLPLWLKWAVYESYVRPEVLYGSEACFLKESFTKDREIHGESNVWSAVQRQKDIYGFDDHAGFEGRYGSIG